jgi:3-oxoacyl-[acyl-carrier protein] reductase
MTIADSHRTMAHSQHLGTPDLKPTVLVTGGSRGIGRAICLEFGRAGWQVAINYRERREDADHTATDLAKEGGEGFPVQADVRIPTQVRGMVRAVLGQWSHLDVVICNAGLSSSQLLLKMKPEDWSTVIETNLTGTFHCLQAVADHMLARRHGSVIVVGSFSGAQGDAGQAAYAASKAGLLGLVRTVAREWGGSNVRVNAVFPGWHRTELSGSVMSDEAHCEDHVLGRTPDVREVARSVFHLASLNDVSGQVWNLDSRILY